MHRSRAVLAEAAAWHYAVGLAACWPLGRGCWRGVVSSWWLHFSCFESELQFQGQRWYGDLKWPCLCLEPCSGLYLRTSLAELVSIAVVRQCCPQPVLEHLGSFWRVPVVPPQGEDEPLSEDVGTPVELRKGQECWQRGMRIKGKCEEQPCEPFGNLCLRFLLRTSFSLCLLWLAKTHWCKERAKWEGRTRWLRIEAPFERYWNVTGWI